MQFKRKNLLLTLSTVLGLGLLTAADCGGDSNNGTTGTTGTTGVSKVDIKVEEWKQIKNAGGTTKFQPTADKVDMLAVSGDKHLYVVSGTGTQLFAVKGDEIGEDSKWKSLGLGATGLTAGIGKEALTTATKVDDIVPTAKGALVIRNSPAGNHVDNGIAYVKGTVWDAAWDRSNTNRSLPASTAVNANAPLKFAGVMVGTASKEIVLAFTSDDWAQTNDLASFTGLLDKTIKYNGSAPFTFGTSTASKPRIGVVMGGNDAYFVDAHGISKLSVVDGTTQVCAAPAANAGHAGWKNGGAYDNNVVTAVVELGGKIYIGLGEETTDANTKANSGGVAVYEYASDTAKAMDVAWKTKYVVDLAVDTDNSKVYAVLKDGIWEVGNDGKLGAKFIAHPDAPTEAPETDKNKTFTKVGSATLPNTNITAAKFIAGGTMVIATSDKALFVRFPAKAEKVKKQ